MPARKKAVKRKADAGGAPEPEPTPTPAVAAPAADPDAGLSKSQRKKRRKMEQKATDAAAAAAQPVEEGASESKAAAAEDVGDIFASLKGAKKRAPAAKAEETAPKEREGGPTKPYVTGPHKGYIPAGGNLAQGRMTIVEAKARALKNPGCMGFTYEGKIGKDNKVLIWLKNKCPLKLEEPGGSWVTYKVSNREKLGDGAFMDLRGEGSSAGGRTTKDGLKVVAADELVMDNGGFTKDCPFDCQCCF